MENQTREVTPHPRSSVLIGNQTREVTPHPRSSVRIRYPTRELTGPPWKWCPGSESTGFLNFCGAEWTQSTELQKLRRDNEHGSAKPKPSAVNRPTARPSFGVGTQTSVQHGGGQTSHGAFWSGPMRSNVPP